MWHIRTSDNKNNRLKTMKSWLTNECELVGGLDDQHLLELGHLEGLEEAVSDTNDDGDDSDLNPDLVSSILESNFKDLRAEKNTWMKQRDTFHSLFDCQKFWLDVFAFRLENRDTLDCQSNLKRDKRIFEATVAINFGQNRSAETRNSAVIFFWPKQEQNRVFLLMQNRRPKSGKQRQLEQQ